MGCSHRLLTIATLLSFCGPTAVAGRPACEADGCAVADGQQARPQLQRDHALLQSHHVIKKDLSKTRTAGAALEPEPRVTDEQGAAGLGNMTADGSPDPMYTDEQGAEGLGNVTADGSPDPMYEGPGLVPAKDVMSATAGSCQDWMVSRRRRQSTCSCRRRGGRNHNGYNLPEGMVCDKAANKIVPATPSAGPPSGPGWSPTGEFKGEGWCRVEVPPKSWNLKACPVTGNTQVKVLTYNLWWWNLFRWRKGNGQSAGKLIARNQGAEGFDLMAFQECNNPKRVLRDAMAHGLPKDYERLHGGRGLAIAFRRSKWTRKSTGKQDVGEDHRDQYYGKRSIQWVRLQHESGRTVLFLNHHGPLPISRSGGCTGSATAFNILKAISSLAEPNDLVILVGDFNARRSSSRINVLSDSLRRVYSGSAFGGVDHIFSNCNAVRKANLGKGGSDHDALAITFGI